MNPRKLVAALASAALLHVPAAAAAQAGATLPMPPPPARAASGTPPAPAAPGAEGEKPAEAPEASKPAAEAPPPVPEKVDPKVFDEALEDYFAGNPRAAAGPLYAWLSAASKTDENYAWAQFFLARSLIDLGLTHAGADYLARIARERSNPHVVPRALEALRELVDRPHDEVMIDEQVFGALDLGFLEEDAGAYAHYQQGLVDLRVGNERWAGTHFAKLPEGGTEASRAKFALLVTRLKNTTKEPSEELVNEFLELSKDEKLTREARNEAALAVARLRYERKDFPGALDAYSRVKLPELDPGRATLYLEEAWTRYKLGQVRAALGILTTLDAPAFRDEFLPDKYLLRALIFRDLCHYLPAKRAAKELTRRFADSLESIRNRDDLSQDLRLRRAADAHGGTKRAARFKETLELEAERLGRYAGSFGRLHTHLLKLYSLAHAEAVRVHETRLAEAVRQEADTLLRAAEQVRLMEYEVGLKLYERVKKGAKIVAPPEEELLSPAQVAFRFDGEYWNDELRSYRVNIESRCIEETP